MKIIIKINEDNTIETELDTAIPIDLFLNATASVQLGAMRTYISNLPPEAQEEEIGNLYDLYNFTASALLSEFAPDLELRPDLTEQAILEAEQMLLKKHKHKRKQKYYNKPKNLQKDN